MDPCEGIIRAICMNYERTLYLQSLVFQNINKHGNKCSPHYVVVIYPKWEGFLCFVL